MTLRAPAPRVSFECVVAPLRILLVEDYPDVRAAVAEALRDAGHDVTLAADGALALERVRAQAFDAIVTDVRLPKVDGLAVFREARRAAPTTDVILDDLLRGRRRGRRGAEGGRERLPDQAVRSRRAGHPRRRDRREARARARARGGAREARVDARGRFGRRVTGLPLGPSICIATVAASDAAVLVHRRERHGQGARRARASTRSARARGPFVAGQLRRVPETLLEAELFGYERGAFTGAAKKRHGPIRGGRRRHALPRRDRRDAASAQAKLLRALQEGEVEPLGTNTPEHVDVRVVAATNRT